MINTMLAQIKQRRLFGLPVLRSPPLEAVAYTTMNSMASATTPARIEPPLRRATAAF
jgi:hypothetical protein